MKHILFSPQPPMMASSRKLLRADENPGAISKKPLYANSPEFLLHISSNNSSASASSTSVDGQRFFRTNKNNSSSAYSYKLSPPFDSPMAVAILVLLVALFFMGFLSVYIRRFADDSSNDPTRRRRRRSSAPNSSASSYNPRTETVAKGADPSVVASLPVYAYDGGPTQKGMIVEPDCAICLSEFEDRECVKVIPLCGHSFHIGCIDMWLSSHVTCPLCRTEQFFPATEDKVVVADAEDEIDAGVAQAQAQPQAQGRSESRVIEETRVVLR